jgi:hypothetical protein
MLQMIVLTLGGRHGNRHCGRLAMAASRVTLLRLVRALPKRPVVPRVLRVDEFALRRARRYGTILVDAQAHQVNDGLEDPPSNALVVWIRRGAPAALQVADRCHLTHNLVDALERYAISALASLRKDLTMVERPRSAAKMRVPLPPPISSSARLAVRTHRRNAEIHQLLEQGLTASAIARQLKLGATVHARQHASPPTST